MASEAVAQEGHSVAGKVIHAVVRGVLGTAEKLTKGFLAVSFSGKRQTLPALKDSILLEPAYSLAEKIRTGQLKSVDVVKAYIRRIKEVNPVINAVIEIRFNEALEDAMKVDLLVESGVKTPEQLASETPLLGVPFSSKEAVLVKGMSATGGMLCRKGMTADHDSEAVARLRNAGGIPLVVTNTSEICMFWETYNKLHGQTNNPYDTTKIAGGSSGGETALIAAAGSVIGLGTDLGGSIRIPSFLCGVFGHKPSNGVSPTGGVYPPIGKQVSPYVVTGPIARYAKDLRHVLKVLTGGELTRQLKLDEQVNFKSIKVYYMMNDGGNPLTSAVSPEIKDCFRNVIFWLKNSGIRTEPIKLSDLKWGGLMWTQGLAEIDEQRIANMMAGDVKTAKELSPPNKEMLKWLTGRSEYTFPLVYNACIQDYVGPIFLPLFKEFLTKRDELKAQMGEILGDDGVFLYPSFPTTAPFHGELIVNPWNVSYGVVFNALGLPVTQCPVGLGSSGLPVGLQVVTGHMNDRLSLTFAEEVEKQFGGWVNPSRM